MDLEQLKQKYLSFYHEVRVPSHKFFAEENNQDDQKTLVISSPSRMGNHLLLSLLDGHPELPQTPGEDGFHMFSFTRAHYALHEYFDEVLGGDAVQGMMNVASNGIGSKWEQVAQIRSGDFKGKVTVSGVGVGAQSGLQDFEGLTFPVAFADYRDELKNLCEGSQPSNYNELLNRYQMAFAKMQRHPAGSRFDQFFVYGGMRTQLKWLCETRLNAKVLISIRSFPSFAVSQIKSRLGDVPLTADLMQEAWEHWFHKVIDAIYLAVNYPEQVGLVRFDDLLQNRVETMTKISDFLGIQPTDELKEATLFGYPVHGNSWKLRKAEPTSRVQEESKAEWLPSEMSEIWELGCQVSL